MRRRAFAAALAALAAPAVVITRAAGARAADPTTGHWSLSASDGATHVQLVLAIAGEHWNAFSSSDVTAAEAHVSVERLRGASAPIAFTVARDPGTFACTGTAGGGSGSGTFAYEPSARFDDALASRGMGRPTQLQSLQLALAGATVAYVDELRAVSGAVSIDDVVRTAQRGVTSAFLAKLKAHGYENVPVRDVLRLRAAGV